MTSYDDYQKHLAHNLAGKSLSVHREFARIVLRRMLPFVENADKDGLWDEEKALIAVVSETVRGEFFNIVDIEEVLRRFETLAEEDDIHALDTDLDIVDFLLGLEGLIALESREDRQAAARISESLMNILDRHFTEETPLSAWLTTTEIKNEFERQMTFLRQRA